MLRLKKYIYFNILFTLFLIILIPTYWQNYGPQNFLWLSDIGLFLSFIAFWVDSPLLVSILMVAVFPLEILWNIDFFTHLITGYNLLGITTYMFETKYSVLARSLSLFHTILPMIWIWYIAKHGYKKDAFAYAIIIFWFTMLLTYFLTSPQENINWAFMPEKYNWGIPTFLWLLIMMIGIPLLIFWPMHLILQQLF